MSDFAKSAGDNLRKSQTFFRFLLAAGLLVPLGGCLDWGYRQIRLGQEQRDIDRVLPADGSRRTDLGMSHFTHAPNGRIDAVVLLVTPDRRVSAKIRATYAPARWAFPQAEPATYLLEGELDPALASLDATGPIDTLRAITNDLLSFEGERVTIDAYRWVAAGLVRLMQRWPAVEEVGLPLDVIADALDRVPTDGGARIGVDQHGTFTFEYRSAPQP